jgi:hypothetical protein
MTKTQTQKLIVVYSFAAIFIGSCLWWNDPLLGMFSMGFILGFMANENFFERMNHEPPKRFYKFI